MRRKGSSFNSRSSFYHVGILLQTDVLEMSDSFVGCVLSQKGWFELSISSVPDGRGLSDTIRGTTLREDHRRKEAGVLGLRKNYLPRNDQQLRANSNFR